MKSLLIRFFKAKATLFWLVGVAILGLLTWLYQGETSTFFGIAEATETVVSVEDAVEILSVHVIPGKEVHPGDTLVRLRRPELTLRISQLTRELDGVSGEMHVSSSEIDSKVAEVRANWEAKRNNLQFEINRLLDERKRNREITARLQSLPSVSAAADSNDAILMSVKSLQHQMEAGERAMQEQIILLQGSQGLQRSKGKAEREGLESELQLLKTEEARLVICATEEAVVDSVNFRPGEKVSPFSPILTLSAHSPTLVRGYIHEKAYNRIAKGDSVLVMGSTERSGSVHGQVVGVGSRIIPFPERLRKIPDLVVWGREVTVSIPAENHFLLGEMVSIRSLSTVTAIPGLPFSGVK
ncbi:MAG TPA: HlyD family efflux transporter periplasmic adaptor subunit [Fibrobacteraceae bacterium]|nr:HlyD family efflux transporter periplasmic adaptor subunit [Fibrobacteraceae bacterium]